MMMCFLFFFFQAEDGIRDKLVTGVQTCALPISVFGTDGGSVLNTAIKYDISTATPTTANVSNTMVQPRASFTGTLVSGKVLIVGGEAGGLPAELFDSGRGGGVRAPRGLPAPGGERGHTPALGR